MSLFFPVSLVEPEQLISTALALGLRFTPLFPDSQVFRHTELHYSFPGSPAYRQQVVGFLSLHNHVSNDCVLEHKGQNYDISKSLLSLPQYLFGIQLWTKVFVGAVESSPKYLESQGEPHS